MKTFWALVVGVFVGFGAQRAWATITITPGNAACANGYCTSTTPFTLDNVYVNTVPSALTYGGGTLPAHPFTITAIKFYVNVVGSAGSTNATFRASDGTNTCLCNYACNQATGPKRFSCVAGVGTGCAFPASATLSYAFTSVGDCAGTTAAIMGNVNVEGNWQ